MRKVFPAAGLAVVLILVLATASLAKFIDGGAGPNDIDGTDLRSTRSAVGPVPTMSGVTDVATIIHGGSGNDLLMGDWGSDWIYGLTGDDTLIGGRWKSTISTVRMGTTRCG